MSKVLEIVNCPNGYKSILKASSVTARCTRLDSRGLIEQRSSLCLHCTRGGGYLPSLKTHDPQLNTHTFPLGYMQAMAATE